MRLIDQAAGNYRFLPGITPYSCGAVAVPGFEIVHVGFQQPVAYRDGFQRVGEFLNSRRRPKAALCGVELRSPRPFSFPGFAEFNAEYTAVLQSWGLILDGINPIARTNVAPVLSPPSEPVLYGFSFTQACSAQSPPTFVVAGAGELPEGILSPDAIVASGDVSVRGLECKARFVLDLMERRLAGLGAAWSQVSRINVYTAHSLAELLPNILDCTGSSGLDGVYWHFTRPPIEGIEFEMDVRGTRTELRI